MTTIRIDNNETFTTEVTVRESDQYTRSVLLKFKRHFVVGNSRGCDEMYLTVDEIENLGRFLIEQSKLIKDNQRLTYL